MGQTFFGLTPDYMKNIYDIFFNMKMHGGWSFIEAYNLPIGLRTWFVEKLKDHFEKEKKEYDKIKSSSKR